MAEAYSIASLASGLKPRSKGVNLLTDEDGVHLSFSLTIPPWPILYRKIWRTAYQTRNSLVNAFYPLGLASYMAVVSLVIGAVLLSEPNSFIRSGWVAHLIWDIMTYFPGFSYCPHTIKIIWSAGVGGAALFFFLALLQRYLLRALLHYHGWMYLEPGQKNIFTQVWFVVIKLLNGRNPLLYSFAGSLPRLPVPSLEDTAKRYLRAMEALQTPEELEKTKQLTKDFLEKEGPTLQRYAVFKSWISDNYVTDWWEKYIYLHGRSSLMINSNYYVLDYFYEYIPSKNQISRAANIIHELIKVSVLVDRETLPPVLASGAVPFCMSQASRMFSTTRIPGKECDELKHFDYSESKHIIVVCKNIFYKLFVFHKSAPYGPLLPWELEDELKRILKDAEARTTEVDEAETNLAVLTAINRTQWAQIRETHFGEGANFESLAEIESAQFVLQLSDETPQSLDEDARYLICQAKHTWYDKSVTATVFKNGRLGANCEHSWGDAVMTAYAWEWTLTGEFMHGQYDENGLCKRPSGAAEHKFAKGREPRRLTWDLTPELSSLILSSLKTVQEARDDLDLKIIVQDSYGKDFMKKCRLSPDAFVQMTLQIAFYKSYGKFENTYESSMTRLFKDGRTETVRPLTVESVAFVKSFLSPNRDNKATIELLRKACIVHTHNSRDCMTGKGFDRHLFALYIISVGKKVESPFLKAALSQKWVLSTSQQPQQQTTRWEPNKTPGRIGPGGGFGPVTDDGYGVSYMFAGEKKIVFHVSSKKASPKTNSSDFGKTLLQTFVDMKALFNETK